MKGSQLFEILVYYETMLEQYICIKMKKMSLVTVSKISSENQQKFDDKLNKNIHNVIKLSCTMIKISFK